MSTTRSRTLIPLTFLCLATACSGDGGPKATDESPPTVSFAVVERRALAGAISASGVLVAREEAAALPELPGYRVLRVLAEEGDSVERGQVLAILDGALLASESARAEAQLMSARVAAERARSEYRRVADLTGRGVIADETIAQRGFEARAAQAQLLLARAGVADAAVRRGRLAVRSPVAGVIVERSVRQGDIAGGAGEPPFRIARDGLFELDAEMPERFFGRLRLGGKATVTLASGERLAGTIRLLGRRVDTATRLGRVRILLPADGGLRLGGFATASIGEAGFPVSVVPERAVSFDGGPAVLPVDARGRVARVPVRTGARSVRARP
jgi:HlyD family secretion protein